MAAAPATLSAPRLPTFAEIYADHFAFVWRCLRRAGVARERLDDLVQDTFLVVAQNLSKFDPDKGHLRSWVYGICSKLAQNERRRNRRKDQPCVSMSDGAGPATHEDKLPSTMPSPLEAAERDQAIRLAERLLASIPESRREVLVLADLEGLPVTEVAEMLGLNLNTTHSKLRAARRDFDEALARHRARGGGTQ